MQIYKIVLLHIYENKYICPVYKIHMHIIKMLIYTQLVQYMSVYLLLSLSLNTLTYISQREMLAENKTETP